VFFSHCRRFIGNRWPADRRFAAESVDTTVVEAADGEAAITLLEFSRFDLLVLELDLLLGTALR